MAYEVAIIGAGPIGIELAVALKRAGVSYVHLEARQVGATMQWWPPFTRWFSSNERIAIAGGQFMPAQEGQAVLRALGNGPGDGRKVAKSRDRLPAARTDLIQVVFIVRRIQHV